MKSMELCTGYFNLLKTIMGAGIVTYPLFFVEFGVILSVMFSVLAAVLTFSSLMMLCECAEYTKSNENTFSAVLSKVWPEVASFFNIIVFVKCFGVSVSYLVLLQPLLIEILNMTGVPAVNNLGVLEVTFIYALLIFPVCSMKDLRSLRFTSIIGVLGVYLCIAGSIYNYMIIKKAGNTVINISLLKYPTYSWIGFAGQFVFSFTCHQNIFSIRSTLGENSKSKMKYIISLGLGTALLLYIVFGLIVYYSYGAKISDNVFASFIDGPVKKGVFIFYTIFISCSFPLQVHPARECLSEWMVKITRSKKGSIVRVSSTGIVIFLCAILGLIPVGLSTIQSAIGGTASAIMCNFIPAICIIKLPRSKSFLEKAGAISLILYGILAATGVFIKIYGKI